MLVVDTSAFVSLAVIDCHELLLAEFDVHTTERVIEELEATAEHDDVHGHAAGAVLDRGDDITVHAAEGTVPETSRIDGGEGSCVLLCRTHDPAFLITDDLRALPELQQLVDADIAISPIVLKALVERDALSGDDARDLLRTLAETRSWLEAPIYRRAMALFDDD